MSRRRVGPLGAAPGAARPTRDASPNGRQWNRAAVGRRSDRTEDVPTADHRFAGRHGRDIPHGDPCVLALQNRWGARCELRLRKSAASTRGAAARRGNVPRRRDRRPVARPGHLHARIHRANHRRPCDGSHPASRHRLRDPGHRSHLACRDPRYDRSRPAHPGRRGHIRPANCHRLRDPGHHSRHAHRDRHYDRSHPANPGRRCGQTRLANHDHRCDRSRPANRGRRCDHNRCANRCRFRGRIGRRRRLAAVDRRWNENRRGSCGRAPDTFPQRHGARIRARRSGHGWGRSPSLRVGDGTRPSAAQLGLPRRSDRLSAVRRRRWRSDRAKRRRPADDHADRHRSETTGIRRHLVPGDPAAGDDAARHSERSRLPVCRSRLLLSSWRVEPSLCFLLQLTPLTRNGHPSLGGHLTKKSGGVLLSHRVPPAVPSAQRVLASGFGM